jgi:hypothetical protein
LSFIGNDSIGKLGFFYFHILNFRDLLDYEFGFFFFFVRFGVQNSFILNFDGVTIFAVAVKLGFFFSFFFHVNVLEKKS